MATQLLFSQSSDSKWAFGVSGSFINFSQDASERIGEKFILQVPTLSAARYFFKGFSVDGRISLSAIDKVDQFFTNGFNYFSVDGTIRYDFQLSKENVVPYVGLGMSFIAGPSTIPGSKTSPTTNFVGGATIWVSPKFGINAQAAYKYSSKDIQSMESHTQLSVGLVYSLRARSMVQRLWDH